jgi:3-oxoacyl-[acyl-carrier protein] reductase
MINIQCYFLEDFMKKTVLITGSSRGIGQGIALAFARGEYRIALNCIHNVELLEQTAQNCRALGSECAIFQADVSSYQQTENLFSNIENQFGPVDILINNAGISTIGLFQDMSYEQWQKILNTNLTSVYNCCHFAIPHMIRQHSGRIINISSVWGIAGASCEVAYSATKGGINSLTRALAKELAPSNISDNAIACGAIDTDMNAFLSEEEREMLIDEIPAGRLGTPSEVGELARNLCESSPYLTGQIVQLDGGWI